VRSYANWEAISFYKEAIRVLDAQAETEMNKREKLQVCCSIIDTLMLVNYPEGSLETLQEAERLAWELKDDRSLMAVYRRFSLYHSTKGDMALGMEYSKKCFDAAERIGDVDAVVMIATSTCMARFFAGDVLGAAAISRRALQLIEERHGEYRSSIGRWTIHSQLSGWCGSALAAMGEFEEARAVLDKGLERSFEANDTFGAGWLEFFFCTLSFSEGNENALVNHARRAIQCFEETGVEITLGSAWSYLGMGYFLLGEYEAARHCAEKGIELQRETGVQQVSIPLCLTNLTLALMALGDHESAIRSATEALKLSQKSKAKLWEGLAWTVLGRSVGGADPAQIDIAEQHLRQGISMTEEMKLRPWSAQGCLYLGELFELTDRREEAIENLKMAETMSREMGMGYWLDRSREALARLDVRRQ